MSDSYTAGLVQKIVDSKLQNSILKAGIYIQYLEDSYEFKLDEEDEQELFCLLTDAYQRRESKEED